MSSMSAEARKAKTEYMRVWRRNNPDKVKRAQDRYWSKKYSDSKEVSKS